MLKVFYLFIIFAAFPGLAKSQTSIIYVDREAVGSANGLSWTNAFTRLTEAFSAANANPDTTEIRIMAGRYTPTEIMGATANPLLVTTPIIVQGGYELSGDTRTQTGRTVVSGDIRGDDANPNPFDMPDNTVQAFVITNAMLLLTNTDVTNYASDSRYPLLVIENSVVSIVNSTFGNPCLYEGCIMSAQRSSITLIDVSSITSNKFTIRLQQSNINIDADFLISDLQYLVNGTESNVTFKNSNWILLPDAYFRPTYTSGVLEFDNMSVIGDSLHTKIDVDKRLPMLIEVGADELIISNSTFKNFISKS
jgi:hypothetical protein